MSKFKEILVNLAKMRLFSFALGAVLGNAAAPYAGIVEALQSALSVL